MRKLKFLFVLLAMVSLASCNFEDQAVIRYEVTSENPDESYVIELSTSESCRSWNPRVLTDTLTLPSGSRTGMISRTLIHCYTNFGQDIMYETIPSDEFCTMKVIYPEKKVSNKKLLDDFINNAGITSDTTYKPSYKLIITNNDNFSEYIADKSFVKKGCGSGIQKDDYDFCCNINYDEKLVDKNHTITNILHLIHNLRTFYHIPVFVDDTFSLNIYTSYFTIDKSFYSGQKSVEEVNEMLSEYGLSLEPTGEEMMVVTLSTDEPIKSAKLFESKSFTKKFFAVLFVGILFCVFATMHVSKEEALAPKSKSIIRVGSAILLWVLAALCLFIFFMFFTEEMQSALHNAFFNIHLINSVSLVAFSFGLILIATGISVFNYRKSYYTILGKILRVIFTLVVFCIMYTLVRIIINSDLHSYILPLSICLIAMVMNIFTLRIQKAVNKD
ncbi:MAG: hypothetical protein IKU01_07375 [Bacteroidales bacterium]|nr:hypothetical protein [Bacteroidales bacterium]